MANEFSFNLAPNQPAFSEEVIVRAFEPLRPWPQNPSAIVYRARVQQLRAYYTRPAFNTPHPNLPQVYFADDIDFQDKTSGMVEWTRIWVTIPNSWNDYTSDAYTFPGIQFSPFTLGRVPVTKTVTSKLNYDYYLVGTLPNYDNAIPTDDINSVFYSKSAMDTVGNAANIPVCAGGQNYATQCTVNSATGSYIARAAGTLPYAAASMFLKAGNCNVVRMAIQPVSNFNYTQCYTTVDMRTGSVVNYANCRPVVAAVGEGWWRIGVSYPLNFASTVLYVQPCDDTGNASNATIGSVFYAWRGQVPNVTTNTLSTPTKPPTTTPDGTNYPVQQADNIPVKFGLNYTYAFLGNYVAEYLSGSTTPNVNTYQGWVSADQNTANSYSIESTDSTLALWQGSVWQRTRNFVKAR